MGRTSVIQEDGICFGNLGTFSEYSEGGRVTGV